MSEQRELTVEEKEKILAEAEVARANAETQRAIALKEAALARKELAEAERTEIQLAKARDEERDRVNADKFQHVYWFNGAVESNSVKSAIAQLALWHRDDPKCSIEIVFNSPGGSVFDGMALFDYIEHLKALGHHITTATMGMAASMGGILLQAGNVRVAHKEAWILIHEIAFGAIGKIGDIEDSVKFAERIQSRIVNIFISRAKAAFDKGTAKKPLSAAYLRSHWKKTDWWISSDEALELGIVDEVR